MTCTSRRPGEENARIARILAHAVDSAGRTRSAIAEHAGIHRETLTRLICGDRSIKLEDASRILSASGVPVRSTLMLALIGQEELACEWMRHEIGEFLEDFLLSLPGALDEALGERREEIRSRWARGTAQLVARMLANHIDDFAARDLGATL